MGKLIPLTACLIFFASSAHAEYVSSPICVFYDSKPEKPYLGFKSQYEMDRYNQEVDSYNDSRSRYIKCINDYVEEQTEAATAHRKAADDAIDGANLKLRY
jgi:hypothetical protein